MTPKKKVIQVCDKNLCISFGHLVLDFERALYAEFDVRILWLKTPRYFLDSEEKVTGDCLRTSSLYEGICPLISPPDHVDGYLAVLDAALCGEQKLDEEKVQALLARFSMKAIAERLTAFFYSLLD